MDCSGGKLNLPYHYLYAATVRGAENCAGGFVNAIESPVSICNNARAARALLNKSHVHSLLIMSPFFPAKPHRETRCTEYRAK